jgi:hypothetical protein
MMPLAPGNRIARGAGGFYKEMIGDTFATLVIEFALHVARDGLTFVLPRFSSRHQTRKKRAEYKDGNEFHKGIRMMQVFKSKQPRQAKQGCIPNRPFTDKAGWHFKEDWLHYEFLVTLGSLVFLNGKV